MTGDPPSVRAILLWSALFAVVLIGIVALTL